MDENKETQCDGRSKEEQPHRMVQGTCCGLCGRTFFPAKEVCSNCYTDEGIAPVELNPFGIVYTFAVQTMMTRKWGPGPLVVCYADMQDQGTRVFGRLDCAPEEARIGMAVELVVDDREMPPDGFVYYHFRPVIPTSEENDR